MLEALANSTRLYEACLVASIDDPYFRTVRCFKIIPQNYDPLNLDNFNFIDYRSNNTAPDEKDGEETPDQDVEHGEKDKVIT